jgi:two-component system, OmpR family, phosphate regulon response regulator PhoB
MKKVLIIEDDGDTLSILGYLATESNVEVVLRSDVLPIAEIEQIKPDLIILDHWIGSHRGGDLCLEIKQNPETAEIPVIMLSALKDIGQIALDSCANSSISKPFDIEEIEEVLQTYLV